MIGLIAAAALLAAGPADPSPYELGRASFFAGMCFSLGWDTSRERVEAFGHAYDARNPTDDMEGRQAEIMRGIQDAQTEVEALVAALSATADAAPFKQALMTRCDAVVRDVPEMLSRTDTTQAAFEAAVADIVSQLRANTPSS